MNVNQDYEGLANAIIIKAVDDYRKALKTLKHNPNNAKAMHSKREIEQFFWSDYFSVLSDVDPEMLIKKLRSEMGL